MIPTLSQVAAYDASHLMTAAAHWDATADTWELTHAQIKAEAMSLDFTGAAADALHDRVALDHMHAVTSATALREAAAVAAQAADMLNTAKRRVMYLVADAQNKGYAVSEDFTAVDERGSSSFAAQEARQETAVILSADLKRAAVDLWTHDAEVGQRIAQHSVQLIDNTIHVHPHDDPFNEYIEPPPFKAPDGKEWHWYTGGKGWRLEDPLNSCDGWRQYKDISGISSGLAMVPIGGLGAAVGASTAAGGIFDITHCEPPGGTK